MHILTEPKRVFLEMSVEKATILLERQRCITMEPHHVRYRYGISGLARVGNERKRGLEEANPSHLVVEKEKIRVIL